MTDSKKIQWLVITDLDGTLLNHHDYDIEDALPAINKLRQQDIPVIFNTSKTFSETISLQNQIKIEAPFVVENGSCIYFPKSLYPDLKYSKIISSREQYWEIVLGQTHSAISDILELIDTPPSYYQLLSACSPEEASNLTGLSIKQAEQAISREFSEPLIWNGGDEKLALFKEQLKEHNLNTLQGGRFLHVLGNCDKGIATSKLKDILMTEEHKIKTIVLGDSANDAAMLEVADMSIIVNSPSNHHLQQMITPNIHTTQAAPAGWSEGIDTALLALKKSKYKELS